MEKNNIAYEICSALYCKTEFIYIIIITLSIIFVTALFMKWKSHIKISYTSITLSYLLILLVIYFAWYFSVAYLVNFD